MWEVNGDIQHNELDSYERKIEESAGATQKSWHYLIFVWQNLKNILSGVNL